MQQWIDEKDIEGTDVFEISNFDFMPIDTKLVGDKIRDTPTNQPQQEDLSQQLPQPQGSEVAPSSLVQTKFCVDKGSATHLPPSTKGE